MYKSKIVAILSRIEKKERTMPTMMHCSPVTPNFTDGITAYDYPLTRERIKRTSVVESLRNPFEEQELLDAIHRVV